MVMGNLFSRSQVIHRVYDIKGSWVDRSAKPPKKGQRVNCRHCNATYRHGIHSGKLWSEFMALEQSGSDRWARV